MKLIMGKTLKRSALLAIHSDREMPIKTRKPKSKLR